MCVCKMAANTTKFWRDVQSSYNQFVVAVVSSMGMLLLTVLTTKCIDSDTTILPLITLLELMSCFVSGSITISMYAIIERCGGRSIPFSVIVERYNAMFLIACMLHIMGVCMYGLRLLYIMWYTGNAIVTVVSSVIFYMCSMFVLTACT